MYYVKDAEDMAQNDTFFLTLIADMFLLAECMQMYIANQRP